MSLISTLSIAERPDLRVLSNSASSGLLLLLLLSTKRRLGTLASLAYYINNFFLSLAVINGINRTCFRGTLSFEVRSGDSMC